MSCLLVDQIDQCRIRGANAPKQEYGVMGWIGPCFQWRQDVDPIENHSSLICWSWFLNLGLVSLGLVSLGLVSLGLPSLGLVSLSWSS